MDTITMNALSEKLGIELKVRDNDKLIDETIDKLLPKMMKKVNAAGTCTAGDYDEGKAMSSAMESERETGKRRGWRAD